jgi:hypothetical protein
MQKRFAMLVTTLTVFSTLAALARADDKKVSVADLPSAIKKAIETKFPKAEIEKAAKEVEDGKTTYEVLLEIDDKPVDVAFKADGTILEIEREIEFESLPARVKKAFKKKYPGAKVEKVEEVRKGEGEPANYEIAIKTEVVMTAKGKVVKAKVEEEEDDDEKPTAKAKKSKKNDDDDDDDKDDDDKRR